MGGYVASIVFYELINNDDKNVEKFYSKLINETMAITKGIALKSIFPIFISLQLDGINLWYFKRLDFMNNKKTFDFEKKIDLKKKLF